MINSSVRERTSLNLGVSESLHADRYEAGELVVHVQVITDNQQFLFIGRRSRLVAVSDKIYQRGTILIFGLKYILPTLSTLSEGRWVEDYAELPVGNTSEELVVILRNLHKMLEPDRTASGAIAIMHDALSVATGLPVVPSLFSHKRPALTA